MGLIIRSLLALVLGFAALPALAQTGGPNPRHDTVTITPPANTLRKALRSESTSEGSYVDGDHRGWFQGGLINNDFVCNDKADKAGPVIGGSACVSIYQRLLEGHEGAAYAIEAETRVDGPIETEGDPYFYGINSIGSITADLGATEGAPFGGIGGLAGTCIAVPPANYIHGCIGAELRTSVLSGVNVLIRTPLLLGGLGSSDTQQGTVIDAAIVITNTGGAAPFRDGILFAPTSGAHIMGANSWLLRVNNDTGNPTVGWGIDLRGANFNDAIGGLAFASNGFSVDPDGDIVVKSCTGCSVAPAQLPQLPGGRLTLTAATPVLYSDVTGGTTIRYALYNGTSIPIFDGSAWSNTVFVEMSQTLADTTKSPAAAVANKNYDIFAWNDAGTLRISRGPAWTSDGVRAVDLVHASGIYLNAGAITNGPAATRGTYLGTIRTNASGTVDWLHGGVAAGGSIARFGIWNAYNRVDVKAMVGDNTDSWAYAAPGATRPSNNSANMRVEFVVGLPDDTFESEFSQRVSTGAGNQAAIAVGYDSTTDFPTAPLKLGALLTASATEFVESGVVRHALPGFHYFQALEASLGSGSATFDGDAGSPAIQNALEFEGRM